MSYADSLRQQAKWVREALDPATPKTQRITLDDIDVEEMEAAAASHDSLVKALRDVRMVHHIGPDTYFGVVGESGCWSVKLPPEAVQIFDEWFTRTRTLLASIGDEA